MNQLTQNVRFLLVSQYVLIILLLATTGALASDPKLPLIDGKKAVATVNNEPITLEDINRTIAAAHASRTSKTQAGRIDYSHILERMINMRLLVLEGRNMGLDELPEITNAKERFAKEALIELLLERLVKDIKAEDAEVERLYKEAVKEWKIKAVKFKTEAAAKKVEAELTAGSDFDTVARKAVAEKIAEGGEAEVLKDQDLTVPVARLISKMKAGTVSPVVSVGKDGFIIFKLEGLRYPEKEDSEAMEKARREALDQKRVREAKAYYDGLKKKYVTINQKVFDALDYESKAPGFEKLVKDERILAEIKGDKPITVAEFSMTLKDKFFHGLESAIASKSVNKQKNDTLELMLEKRLLRKEALKQGLDKEQIYKDKVTAYENAVIFNTFMQKVVVPEIKLNPNELQTFYRNNRQKYTSPRMMRIKSLVFAQKNTAVEALDKLMKGTDFNWLSANADGQVDKNTAGLLKFGGQLLVLDTMPQGVQKVVSGANPGDFRLYEGPGGYYVLYIYHVVAPQLQPFEAVKKDIAKTVYNEKIKNAIEGWADKLKAFYPVKIYDKGLKNQNN